MRLLMRLGKKVSITSVYADGKGSTDSPQDGPLAFKVFLNSTIDGSSAKNNLILAGTGVQLFHRLGHGNRLTWFNSSLMMVSMC